jgi:glycopeptide antibiotics resistance protein
VQARTRRKRAALGLLVLLGSAAFALSLLLPESAKRELHTAGRFHLTVHFALFVLFGVLCMATSSQTRKRLPLLAAAILLGFAIELAESLHFQIELEINDVLMDTSGVLVGALASYLLFRKRP